MVNFSWTNSKFVAIIRILLIVINYLHITIIFLESWYVSNISTEIIIYAYIIKVAVR